MIKKRKIVLNVMALMAIGLFGCSNEKSNVSQDVSQSVSQSVSQGDTIYNTSQEESKGQVIRIDYSLYDGVIDDVKKGLSEGFNNDDIKRLSLSEDLVFMGAPGSKNSNVGYIRKDIDNNSVDELIIGKASSEGNFIYNMYTIADGKLVTLLSGKERNSYYLCNDGVISNYCSSGVGYAQSNYYNIQNSELTLIESVFQNRDRNPGEPKQFYHSTIATFDPNATAISDSDAESIRNKYQLLQYSLTFFNN